MIDKAYKKNEQSRKQQLQDENQRVLDLEKAMNNFTEKEKEKRFSEQEILTFPRIVPTGSSKPMSKSVRAVSKNEQVREQVILSHPEAMIPSFISVSVSAMLFIFMIPLTVYVCKMWGHRQRGTGTVQTTEQHIDQLDLASDNSSVEIFSWSPAIFPENENDGVVEESETLI